MTRVFNSIAAAAVMAAAAACQAAPLAPEPWSDEELDILRSLWIGSLGPVPPDPTNRWADDTAAAALGHRLFFDTRLSANGRVSCASCHNPETQFQDGTPLGTGVGTTDRRTMPIAGMAHSPWQFWDGRKDSQWAQALGPLESAVEHGGARALYAHVVAREYGDVYERVFGPLPDLSGVPQNAGPAGDAAARDAWQRLSGAQRAAVTQVFVSIGKAIAAYERRIGYAPARFDHFVEALLRDDAAAASILSRDEMAGLRLFIGRAACTQCHNGPLLTNHDFHNTGVPAGTHADRGRAAGALLVLADEFNCRSSYSDAPADCPELDFMVPDGPAVERAFKVPSLRNVAERAPYMHAGQIATLADALAHYNAAPAAPAGHSELRPLRLTPRELAQLEAFLRSLTGPLTAPPHPGAFARGSTGVSLRHGPRD